MSVAIILLGLGVCLYAWLERPRPIACDEDDDQDEFVDRRGILRRPGQEPREVDLP